MEQKTLQAIQAHAVAEYPRECCGLVVATAAGEQYLPCRNTAETPSEHFRLPAEDYADAEDQGELLAVVHSHPQVISPSRDHRRRRASEFCRSAWRAESRDRRVGASVLGALGGCPKICPHHLISCNVLDRT